MLEEFGYGSQVRTWFEDFFRWKRIGISRGRGRRQGRSRYTIGAVKTGNRHLGPDTLEAALHGAAYPFLDLGETRSARVCISHCTGPRAATQQLIHRHAGALAFDVPQRRIDTGKRGHLCRAAAPVRCAVEELPCFLNLFW